MDKRPTLNRSISIDDFEDFYWLKTELVEFCRADGLLQRGSKVEIAGRILHYLKTGKKSDEKEIKKVKSLSSFDWNRELLTHQTVITDNYKNSKSVREFFQKNIDNKFRFSISFMAWMKENVGKTLGDGVAEYKNLQKQSEKSEIAPQFEYNKYIRDFLEDNPNKTKKIAIECWNIKRRFRGTNKYERSDLTKI